MEDGLHKLKAAKLAKVIIWSPADFLKFAQEMNSLFMVVLF